MPDQALDKTDCEILHHVQLNAKMPNNELADAIGLSPSPCLRRVKALEANGIIKRYVAIIDAARVGLPISVFVSIRLRGQDRATLEEFETRIPRSEGDHGVLSDDRDVGLSAARGGAEFTKL